MSKVRELKEESEKIAQTLQGYFTINDLAKKLEVSWPTARQILMELLLEGKIEADKTPKSWIFKARKH